MASQSEQSYGARLFRASNLLSYITNFTNYAPPRQEESLVDFGNLINNITAANATESGLAQNYNMAVTTRHNLFRKDPNSIVKLLPNIRAAILSQYGKNSIEFNQIDGIIKTMRNAKVIHIAATATQPESTISQSEQSYGSLTQYFSNLVSTLSQLTNYNPSNANIQINSLQTFITQINGLNTQVATTYQALRNAKSIRNNYYTDLSDRATRIKSYVKATYGITSQEFTLIKGLKI